MITRTGPEPARWRVYLALGRVSNLPTVWSNAMAGAALASGNVPLPAVVWVAVAVSCFYTAGMYLNDAFDAEYDQRHRPERPIPRGAIDPGRVGAIGFALLAAGELLLVGAGPSAAVLGLVLAGLIVYYSIRHKRDPLSPVVMALCRACVYLIAAAPLAAGIAPPVVAGAGLLAAYVVGLSVVAKRDLLPGPSIAMLIAGISIVDAAVVLWATGAWPPALVAAAGFPLTLALQRVAPGT